MKLVIAGVKTCIYIHVQITQICTYIFNIFGVKPRTTVTGEEASSLLKTLPFGKRPPSPFFGASAAAGSVIGGCHAGPMEDCCTRKAIKRLSVGRFTPTPLATGYIHAVKGAITSKIKYAIKHKTSPARLAQLLQPSLAFCFSLQPMTAWLQAKTKC